jgi:hypothetical protein
MDEQLFAIADASDALPDRLDGDEPAEDADVLTEEELVGEEEEEDIDPDDDCFV